MKDWNRACKVAKKLLRKDKQCDYFWLIFHSDHNGRPELRKLKAMLSLSRDFFGVRVTSYQRGLVGEIFKPIDTRLARARHDRSSDLDEATTFGPAIRIQRQ